MRLYDCCTPTSAGSSPSASLALVAFRPFLSYPLLSSQPYIRQHTHTHTPVFLRMELRLICYEYNQHECYLIFRACHCNKHSRVIHKFAYTLLCNVYNTGIATAAHAPAEPLTSETRMHRFIHFNCNLVTHFISFFHNFFTLFDGTAEVSCRFSNRPKL